MCLRGRHTSPVLRKQSSGSWEAWINRPDNCSNSHTTCFGVCAVCQPLFEQEGENQTKPHTHKNKKQGKKYTWRFWKPSDNYQLAPNSAGKYQNNVTAFEKPLKSWLSYLSARKPYYTSTQKRSRYMKRWIRSNGKESFSWLSHFEMSSRCGTQQTEHPTLK